MGATVLDMRGDPGDSEMVGRVARHVGEGGLVAMPTETVYGFGCIPDPGPMGKLQGLKGRGPGKPFLLLVPGEESVPELEWTDPARELAAVFWPGALTLILSDPGAIFPQGVRSQSGGVAVRVSPNPLAKTIVEAVGRPMVSTSANTPGGAPALSADEVLRVAQGLGAGDWLWVLDGGTLRPSDPSTIIDCTGSVPVVRRPGAIPTNRIRCVLPEIHETA